MKRIVLISLLALICFSGAYAISKKVVKKGKLL